MIFDLDVATQGGTIRHDHVVPDLAIMGHMSVSHQKIAIPQFGFSVPVNRGSVDCHIFTNNVVAPNDRPRVLARVFEILGFLSDRGKLKDLTVLTDGCVSAYDYMGTNLSPLIDDDVLLNDRIGTDINTFRDLGCTVNHGCRMNHQIPLSLTQHGKQFCLTCQMVTHKGLTR